MTTTTHPAAYLRRSFVDKDSPGDISREAQRETVRKLATADGHNGDLVEYDDWGISADIAKSAKRTAYARLLADMEAGRVSAVYAFDVDRLYRDPRDLIRLQDAAQAHRVTITTTSGRLAIGDGDDPASEGFAFIGAVFGRMELQKAKKRARAAQRARQARGDSFGRPSFGYRMVRAAGDRVTFEPDPTEPIEPLLAAFLEAGSFSGAAKLLNQRGIPTKRGATWQGNTVNRILRRERPGVAPRGRVDARVAPRGSQRFSRLLRCPHEGQLLTPRATSHTTKYGSYGPYIGYQCSRARYDPSHPRPYMVNEPAILEWAKAEATHLEVPWDWLERARDDSRRIALEAEREQLGDKLLARVWSPERIAARADTIDAELSALAEDDAIEPIPAIDWNRTPKEINAALRALFEYIELDADMKPVAASWRTPEWRR